MSDAPYQIRRAHPHEVTLLAAIEDAAAGLFAATDLGTSIPGGTAAVEDLAAAQRAGMLWVAAAPGGEPVGFAYTRWLGDEPHLEELDVHPDHGRRGLGAQLVREVVAWARSRGASGVTLSTFRDVPWNAPFYARLGFRALDPTELAAPLRELVAIEARKGLPVERRVVMRLALGSAAIESRSAGGRMKILDLIAERLPEKYALHDQHLNGQIVKVLKTIGYDVAYTEARGQYLFDGQGHRYLDLLSGWGVFAVGRNHPKVIEVLNDVLHGGLPHLVQMDVTVLAGMLAERLVAKMPAGLEKIFFCNSGAESVEAAIKFARYATKRSKIVYVERGYHGLTYGPLSINGMDEFREGFGPLLPDCVRIPFDDLPALENALRGRDVAAFIVEPIIGHGVHIPSDEYLPGASALCKKYGALLVCDEVQTGLGRTGKFLAVEHWGVEPDMVCMAKALSGGFVPVGAVACRKWVFDAVFDRMDRAVVHGSTYSKNNLAMAAGLATLEVIDDEKLIENSAALGQQIVDDLRPLVDRFEFLKDVRGKGMMIALEFGKPESFKLRAAWKLLGAANESLFGQLITVPLFTKHRILSQVAGHAMHIVKFLPPLNITQDDRKWVVSACTDVISETHQVGGAVWDLGKQLAGAAIRMRSGG